MADRQNYSSDTSSGGTAGMAGTMGTSDWTTEENYWRTNFSTRPYAGAGRTFDDFQPAYRYGYDSATKYRGRKWHEVETDLERGWDTAKGKSESAWKDMKEAVKDAWHRVERAMPGDFDRDGR